MAPVDRRCLDLMRAREDRGAPSADSRSNVAVDTEPVVSVRVAA